MKTIMKIRIQLLAACLLISNIIVAQTDHKILIPKLKGHISKLASDKFEGRETGSPGEKLSSDYITAEFKKAGISPKGSNGYLQPFPFTKKISASESSRFVIDGHSLVFGTDFFPLAYSSNGKASGQPVFVGYGITATSLDHDDYKGKENLKGKILVMESGTPDKGGPHSKYAEFSDMRTRIENAISKGAVAVVFINSGNDQNEPTADYRNRVTPSSIPVVFVKSEKRNLFLKENLKSAEISTELKREEGTGNNVIGYIDNKAEHTVIIGAHYDHLGFGEESSLHRGDPLIHNGADDNASGVAAMIEIARYLKENNIKGNNYMFIAFSGEEKGLLGSGYFVKNPTVELSKVNYMLNMDMIGRLKEKDPVLIINGAGTSDAWKVTFEYIRQDSLKIKTTESGVGPSDHTSFYLKDIPVLHFFSGTHSDYHKPSDDEPLINYNGTANIIDFMISLISKTDNKGKLGFIKTKDDTNEEAPRFKVTLGVVPDYAFEGAGMRIDGITEGKPAANAGLKAGDVVVRLGEHKVLDMMSYMKALGKFSKGETTDVEVMRDGKSLVNKITF